MPHDPVVIVGAARTAIGAFQGAFKTIPAPRLGASAISAALMRAGLQPDDVDEVIMGNVLSAGQGQAPARQAALAAGLPLKVGCTTVNKMCGSGMKAAMLAHDLLMAGTNDIMIAGGMENMTSAPYLLPKAREGMRLGHAEVKDHLFLDGLEDAYDRGRLMGVFAEETAAKYGFSRETQDRYAISSLKRAQDAIKNGWFTAEIAALRVDGAKTETIVDTDEQPLKARVDRIPQLKPAFRKDGTVTPANSSSISDGAAALALMKPSQAQRRGIQPRARILAHATHAQKPNWFTTAPVGAITKVLEKAGWEADAVDLYEINEAFAVVAMAALHDPKLPQDKVNVHGGACALGHPIGASGARIVVTLLAALEQYGLRRGVAALCIGGGEATALAVERLS
jgi:acetyl-CoA C-acetyltransferase